MKRIVLYVLSLLFVNVLFAQNTPQWSTDIAPLFYQHCTTCHHSGGLAPFSLVGYTDA
ncbi:MAG: hypothetical protein RLZZ367_689, partial [Bacteroidota bacterium]